MRAPDNSQLRRHCCVRGVRRDGGSAQRVRPVRNRNAGQGRFGFERQIPDADDGMAIGGFGNDQSRGVSVITRDGDRPAVGYENQLGTQAGG